jgi:hypothetical protein
VSTEEDGVDEAGRTPQPPLVMAPPSLETDPDGEDTGVDISIMSRKTTDASRPGVTQRANGSSEPAGGSATSTGDETTQAEASNTVPLPAEEIGKAKARLSGKTAGTGQNSGWQGGRQSMTSGESKDPAASPGQAQDAEPATRSDLKPVTETTAGSSYSGTGYSRPASYTRSEWSDWSQESGPTSTAQPGASAATPTSASRTPASSVWAGAGVPSPAAAGDGTGSAPRNGYSPGPGFSPRPSSAVGGAAAGPANSASSAWQNRGSARDTQTRKPSKRQAMLTLARVEPWSVMKFSFVASVVAFIVLFVAVAVLYMVLSALGVFDSLQSTVSSITSSQSTAGTNISHWFSASLILGYTAMLGALNIVLITAMCTVGSVIYNLIAKTIGGIEVTLRETD